ncbi:hypothetical protein P154DRAFT_541304 [Amniculicola lignicola CBS 123094]|uniref:Rhodopsin domain-containing protein n=1 Tax=Amniculicola lignicola CBS 123094 TaxID=1392246 RepID=A0A6A5X579_9PLEO|nr:hypothetical protein P154DRAFT_541304 [Amniculicola lignicola CBS 123094]
MRFGIESWIWYTFAVGIIVARLTSRTLLFGSPKGLQYDDWIMGIFVVACYTVLIVMSNIEAEAQSNLLPPGFDISTLTLEDIADREYGSKIVIVVEQMQIVVIWACKACLLILYHRLTRMVAPKSNVAIKLLAAYVALGFVVMEILYFAAWCRPFPQYWAVPTKSSQCNALINHRITNAVFNLSSDLIMLCIALPMFLRSLLPWKRKLILCCIFSLGIFVIMASVLNKYYSFTAPYESTWISWYARESSTAILVANLPFTWTLLRKLFKLGAFDEHHPPPPTYHSSRTAGGRRTQRVHHGSGGGSHPSEKPANDSVSHTKSQASAHSMSLIGSLGKPRILHGQKVSDKSQDSGNALLDEENIQQKDFGAISPPPDVHTTDHPKHHESEDLDIDLERALNSISPMPTHLTHLTGPATPPQRPRPMSPASSRTSTRLSFHEAVQQYPDGTGGFVTSPRRAHLLPTSRSGSRASSIASTDRRPMSPETVGGGERKVAAGGGGRSARDRRARARLSR